MIIEQDESFVEERIRYQPSLIPFSFKRGMRKRAEGCSLGESKFVLHHFNRDTVVPKFYNHENKTFASTKT